ncbi:hypothetical protein ES319_A07G150200v1 [Gossypium barbadense]|uniref:Uncharacterized protein n=2 Tax=Gossypium TaxID=3633 RepID=A0A5J5V4M5_GOSBA|nr:hypothetical protein ES319_A07G150200v1 [Gossypium barbadense]
MNGYSTFPIIYKIIFLSFSTHLTSSSNSQLPYEIFFNKSQRLSCDEQEEGFERTTVAAMVKKISITKKALIPGLIKPSRMSKGCLRVTVFLNDTGTSDDMDKSVELLLFNDAKVLGFAFSINVFF